MSRRRGKRKFAWNGINVGLTIPPDTVNDIFYLHIPGELSDDDITLHRIIGRLSLENVDTADSSVQMGATLAFVELDELQNATTDIDPLGAFLEDFSRKNILWHKMFTANASSASNNYWREFEIDVSAKRRMTQNHAIALFLRANSANDMRYEGRLRALFSMS